MKNHAWHESNLKNSGSTISVLLTPSGLQGFKKGKSKIKKNKVKISAVAACLNSFSFLSDHGMCHTIYSIFKAGSHPWQCQLSCLCLNFWVGPFLVMFFLKTCQGWRFTLKMVRHQKGPFLIRAILIILEKKKPPLVGLKSRPKSPSPCYAQWHPTPLKPNYIFLL